MLVPSIRNEQKMQTMSYGLPNFLGATAAWLCLAPVAFACEPLSLPSALASASTPTHYIVNLSLFLVWVAGGIFLVGGGLLAFARFRVHEHKSDPMSGPAQVYRSTELDLAWTLIPALVLVLLLFLA